MSQSPRDSSRLVIPSEPARIAQADEFIEKALREHNLPDGLVSDLAIAATELVNNAILHGNKKDPSKSVTILVEFASSEVMIRVEDQGAGFDPGAVPDPLAQENLLREVGRGIFIVRSLMDDLTFEQVPGGGMAVVLRKRYDPV
jgi:serine/threonine-protein kinase RsbW